MKNVTVKLIKKHEEKILKDWLTLLRENDSYSIEAKEETEFFEEIKLFLETFTEALSPNTFDLGSGSFEPLKKIVIEFARKNTALGYSAKESALYIFSLKEILFNFLLAEYEDSPKTLVNEIKIINQIIDELGSTIYDTFVNDREGIIRRQRQELMEAATPIIKIWEGILGIPVIGTIDSVRAQQIMDTLLTKINDTNYEIAIIDISGVSTLDTLTAQYLLKTASAARLMGATCIVSGISPNIAQTIISLDIDLGQTITKGSMSEAIKKALEIMRTKKKNKYKLNGEDSDIKNRQDTDGIDPERYI